MSIAPETIDIITNVLVQESCEEELERSLDGQTGLSSEVLLVPQRLSSVDQEAKLSSSRVLLCLVKGFVGTGMLSLPYAFKNGGLWFSFVTIFALGGLIFFCIRMLINCSEYLGQKSGQRHLDYGHMAKKAFDFGPERLRHYSKRILIIINLFVAVMSVGGAAVQLTFISANINKVLNYFYPEYMPSNRKMMCLVIWPIMLLDMVVDLRLLSLFTTGATIFLVIGYFFIMGDLIVPPNEYGNCDFWFHDIQRLLLFVGTAVYIFEGQSGVVVLYHKMRTPKDFLRRFGVLDFGQTVILCILTATGFFGYLKYGAETAGTITLNMPQTMLYQVVLITQICSVYIGCSLNVYWTTAILWPSVLRKLPSRFRTYRVSMLEYVFRAFLVCMQFALAMLVPKLDLIIPLVGSTAGVAMSLILPPVLNSFTFWAEWCTHERASYKWCLLVRDLSISMLGVFCMIGGLWANVKQIAAEFQHL